MKTIGFTKSKSLHFYLESRKYTISMAMLIFERIDYEKLSCVTILTYLWTVP